MKKPVNVFTAILYSPQFDELQEMIVAADSVDFFELGAKLWALDRKKI